MSSVHGVFKRRTEKETNQASQHVHHNGTLRRCAPAAVIYSLTILRGTVSHPAQVITEALRMRRAGFRNADVMRKLKTIGLRSTELVSCVQDFYSG